MASKYVWCWRLLPFISFKVLKLNDYVNFTYTRLNKLVLLEYLVLICFKNEQKNAIL